MRQIFKQRGAPCFLVNARPNMAVEVAIWAFTDAKRPMDIEGDWRTPRSFGAYVH